MAEIKIEKKSPIWPWILLIAVVIAILIYVFASGNDDDNTDDLQDNVTEQPIEERSDRVQNALYNSSITTYVNFINDDPDVMGLDHEFTNEALLKLTNATTAMADEMDYDIQKDIEALKMHAEKITNDPFETSHANSIRDSADILSNILMNIQQKAFSNLASDAEEVKNAAAAIVSEELTLDQKEEVKNWFGKSANLLEKMNTNATQS